ASAKVTPTAGRPSTGTTGGGAGEVAGSRPDVKFVRSKKFQLGYTINDVGPSKVKHVDIWMTRDTRVWQKLPEAAGPEGPHEVTLASEGRWGFTLIPVSGVGLSERPPSVGDQPQVWIEVDETKPVVNLYRVEIGRGGVDNGRLILTWSASDKWLK